MLRSPLASGRNRWPGRGAFPCSVAWMIFFFPGVSPPQGIVALAGSEAIAPIIAPFPMPQPVRPEIPRREFDIRSYGAQEGGEIKNTEAIRIAIQTAETVGGGVVVVPQGKWLTGAIHLDNHIELHLAAGAELLFSQDPQDYLPVVFSRHEEIECYEYSSFIYADSKRNLAITGDGILNGQGKPWWSLKETGKNAEALLNDMAARGVPLAERIFDGNDGRKLRPAFFQPMRCTNVLVEGVTFLYGAFWTVAPTYCENVIVRNVRIQTAGAYGHTPNGDGVDFSSCRNILIEHCILDTGDDCIAIKAGRDSDGLRVNLPTENVIIRHCSGLQGHGGVVIGSETAGGVRNIFAFDCQFTGTDRIVRIKSARGRGGVLENMWFRDMTGDKIAMEAIHLNLLYTGSRFPEQPVSRSTPLLRNVHFAHISCTSGKSYGIELLGLPEMPIENVTFDSISIQAAQGVNCVDVKNVSFSTVTVMSGSWPAVTITDGDGVRLEGFSLPEATVPFLLVQGPKARAITVAHTAAACREGAVSLGRDVSRSAVVIGN